MGRRAANGRKKLLIDQSQVGDICSIGGHLIAKVAVANISGRSEEAARQHLTESDRQLWAEAV